MGFAVTHVDLGSCKCVVATNKVAAWSEARRSLFWMVLLQGLLPERCALAAGRCLAARSRTNLALTRDDNKPFAFEACTERGALYFQPGLACSHGHRNTHLSGTWTLTASRSSLVEHHVRGRGGRKRQSRWRSANVVLVDKGLHYPGVKGFTVLPLIPGVRASVLHLRIGNRLLLSAPLWTC